MSSRAEVEFALFAPYNERVALIGSWSDWESVEMTRGGDGWWRVEVPLEDGDYEYKFEVVSLSFFASGETVYVADPRGTRVKADADGNSLLTIRDGEPVVTTYDWQHDAAPLPPNPDLVFYELHIADFSGGIGDATDRPGMFDDVIAKLDYLVDLGVNALELMPVNEFPGMYSWGYNLKSLFAVENDYGTPDDLCRLVDECHARGIRVIIDGVYNHSESDAPLTQIDYDYWYERYPDEPPEQQWGPKFDVGRYDENLDVWPAREHIRDAIRFMIDTFHVDGIRFDATAAIDNYDFLHWLQGEIYKHIGDVKPFITIAEHVPEDPTITGPDGPLDAAWHENFSKQMMSTITMRAQDGHQPLDTGAVAHALDPRNDGYASPLNVVHYIDNHDQERIMWQLGDAGIFDDAAFRRMTLGASLLLTAPGLPLIWMGQEFGESAPRTLERQPIDWALLQNERNSALHDTYASLLALRREAPALRGETFEITCLDGERGLLAFKRWNDEGNVIVVAANLRDDYAGEADFAHHLEDGVWHEWTHNYDVEVHGGVLRDSLAESEVKVYVKQP